MSVNRTASLVVGSLATSEPDVLHQPGVRALVLHNDEVHQYIRGAGVDHSQDLHGVSTDVGVDTTRQNKRAPLIQEVDVHIGVRAGASFYGAGMPTD